METDTVDAEPQPPTHSTDRRALDQSLVSGLAWTVVAKSAAQFLRWASTLVIARLLTPADYGLVGMAIVYTGLVRLVNEFGLSAAIIQKRQLSEDQIARIGGVSVLLGIGFAAVSVVMAGPVAAFFSEPAVRGVVIAISVTFVLSGLQVVPRALMNRDLEYRRLAWIDGTEAFVLAAGTLLLAALGFGYWSLVWGSLMAPTAGLVLSFAYRPHRIAWPSRFGTIASAVTFGWHVVVSRVAWYVYSNADFAIVGRVLGAQSLGAYTIGWNLASIPVERVSALLARVAPGIFSNIQRDEPAMRRYVLGLTEGLAMVSFPVSVGMCLVAREFVLVVLGDQWEGAVIPLTLLAVYGGFRSLTTILPHVLVSKGFTKQNMAFSVAAAFVMPAAFYVGSRWGTTGVAAAWIVAYPFVVVPFIMRFAFRIIHLPWSGYLASIWPALTATGVMALAVLATKTALPDTVHMAVRLGAEVAVGVASYGGVVFTFHRERLATFRRLLRASRKR